MRDVLAIPPAQAVADSLGVHPPVYLRALIAYHWCRRTYGRGPSDDWERDCGDAPWANAATRRARSRAPHPTRERRVLRGAAPGRYWGPLAELFDFDAVSPVSLGAATWRYDRIRHSFAHSGQRLSSQCIASFVIVRPSRSDDSIGPCPNGSLIWLRFNVPEVNHHSQR